MRFFFSLHVGSPCFWPVAGWASPLWYHCTTVWHRYPVLKTIIAPLNVTYMTHSASAVTVVDAPPPCPYTHQEAWTLLAGGHVEEAMGAMACLAAQYPDDGLPHVGYALANAMAGADGAAVAAMRFAVTTDAESLLVAPADERLDEQLWSLIHRLTDQARDPRRTADALFMIAAVRTILHDHAGAHFTITRAIAHGDRDPSAEILRSMLVEELEAALYR